MIYHHIDSNKRKSLLLVALFFAFVIFLGWALGAFYADATSGIVFAAIFATIMALSSYFQGDKVALWSSGARPISKEENPYVYRMVENLCITAGIPMPKIHIIEDSAMNAFATGRDPQHASIALTTGIIQRLENEELEGVIAHELSHIKNYDIRLMTLVIVLVGTVSLLSDWLLRSFLWRDNDRDGRANPVFMILGIILIILSPIIAKLIQLAVSRKREFLADASGALMTRYPEGLASALKKISSSNQPLKTAHAATAHLFFSNPFGNKKSFAHLFSTHPPIEDRIAALLQISDI